MNFLLIVLGKIVLLLSRALNLGSGSTWPGHIAMETNPKFVHQFLKNNPNVKVVLVAGTNGKTTTSLMLQKILVGGGLKVFRNEAGANLLNGIASSIVENASFMGRLNFDVAIFEVDENNLKFALKEIDPYAILLLNIFRDQLDRYGEVNKVIKDWQTALLALSERSESNGSLLFTNGDDPALSYLARNLKLKTYLFGIDEKLMTRDKIGYDVDFIYCPNCQSKLEYDNVSYSHMGKFKCPKCDFKHSGVENFSNLFYPLIGIYNVYNTNAAALVAKKAFSISIETVNKALKPFKPAFGRQEIINYKGRKIFFLLSKNPTGFNQSIDTVHILNQKGNILLVLNDRIPDGRDVSWIWDVDTEGLFDVARKIFIGGDRAYDMGLRIKYSSPSKFQIEEDLEQATNMAISETKPDETLFIFPTYSAMLEVRKILTGKKIL